MTANEDTKPMITLPMIREWQGIENDLDNLTHWQHWCRTTEPLLFMSFWEEYIRRQLPVFLRESGPAIAMNPGCMRTYEHTLERLFMMGFFFGQRRFEASLEGMNAPVPNPPKTEDDSPPDRGGFAPKDFLL